MTGVQAGQEAPTRRELMRSIKERNPPFFEALVADTRAVRLDAGLSDPGAGARALLAAVKLTWTTDAFAAQAMYRLRARLMALRVPILPRILHHLAMISAKVVIGDPVVIAPGLNLTHGQVVIDGLTEIGPNAKIGPFVTIGLKAGDIDGPTLAEGVQVGTGARIVGPVQVGEGSRIEPNAVVVTDIPAGAVAAGLPARVAEPRSLD